MSRRGQRMLVGVISDTHGLMRPEALAALRGARHILHAGDIGSPDVLAALAAIAPVTAVRGNNDRGAWADALPEHATVEFAGVRLHVVHERAALAVSPAEAHIAAVITGHSHRPGIAWEGAVLFLNPGSAGPRRFTLPICCARLHIDGGRIEAEIVELGDRRAERA